MDLVRKMSEMGIRSVYSQIVRNSEVMVVFNKVVKKIEKNREVDSD